MELSKAKGELGQEQKFIVDYGAVNLESLIITNNKEEYEKRKAQNNVGVLFEPKVILDVIDYPSNIYKGG